MDNSQYATWQLMSSHGLVLLYILRNRDATIREVSQSVGLTERRVSQILNDLRFRKVVTVRRQGRRNNYEFNVDASFNDLLLRSVTLGQLVDALGLCDKIP